MTQKQIVKRHLDDYGSITSWEAFKEYGITRLSHYIYLLRKEGIGIKNIRMSCINRYGSRCNYAKYELEVDDDQVSC